MIIELKKRRNFPSLGMCKPAAYDLKCDATGLEPAQFSVHLSTPDQTKTVKSLKKTLWHSGLESLFSVAHVLYKSKSERETIDDVKKG